MGRLAALRRFSALLRYAGILDGAQAGGRRVAGLLPSLPARRICTSAAAPDRPRATRDIASAPRRRAAVLRPADSCWSLVCISSPSGEDGPRRTKFFQGPMRLGPFRLPSIRGTPSRSGPLAGSGARNGICNQRRRDTRDGNSAGLSVRGQASSCPECRSLLVRHGVCVIAQRPIQLGKAPPGGTPPQKPFRRPPTDEVVLLSCRPN